ncbi:MAG: sterol desaturase family protein [Alphaproteobacteria bacterium]|nr:sterol desaturase family protein [Alphaproteobacteria bacterium]
MSDEPIIRLVAFLCVLAALSAWELRAPRRRLQFGRMRRWPSNLGLVLLNGALVRLLAPISAVGLAALLEERQWGLLALLELQPWLRLVLALVLLDLAIYLQHVLFHAIPALWRLHRMHHADLDFDLTTGLRFHPIEILLSFALKLFVVAALGPPVLAVLLFEVILNATSMFNHANGRLPDRLDAAFRWLVVTPDMHRLHHSVQPAETNSNFGFNLPWWDRLLGTYRAEPVGGHAGMTVGLSQFREPSELGLWRLLTQPFRAPPTGYPLGQR